MTDPQKISGIWDNHQRGAIGDFLRERIKPDSTLSFVSAYFTIYAYAALKDQLDGIEHLRFLFGEPRFIQSLDPDKTEKKAFRIEDDALSLSNRLEQKRVARECSQWLEDKVDVRSIMKPGFLHGKMYHTDNNGVSEAICCSRRSTPLSVHSRNEQQPVCNPVATSLSPTRRSRQPGQRISNSLRGW